ncbi:BatD family protein [Desulfopila sp. IMCC35008]|uniref:BatD family protein n=1 Tax=Desulfopila sp. IMCC35008 TaxID=2653858 RepID=UPI0013CF706F|nr:BatD family protein [Desulfopila sp. IMCC35008]
MKKTILLLGPLLLLILSPLLSYAEVTVSATLSPISFPVDRPGKLAITISGTKKASLDMPRIDGVDFVYRGQYSQDSNINGEVTLSLTATYSIHPTKAGKYTLPPITITTGSKTLATEPIEFEVTSTGSSSPQSQDGALSDQGGQAGADKPYMAIENLQNSHYVGEVIPIRVRAFFPQGMRISQISYPRLIGEGCVIPQLKEDPIQRQETVKGVPYTTLTWETELTPVKEGEHPLHLEMDAVQIIQQRRTSTSMFGSQSPFGNDLFDDFFGTARKQQLHVTSTPQLLKAMPLPDEGRPADFTGTVGTFEIETAVSPQQAEVGEPLSMTIIIRGVGNIDGVEPPSFPASPDWKVYTPVPLDEDTTEATKRGEKRFEQAIVAKSDKVIELPALRFSYFNPNTKQYETAQSAPLPLTITGAKQSPPTPVSATEEPVEKQLDTPAADPVNGLAPLHFRLGEPVERIRPLFMQKIYLAGVILLIVLIAAAALLHRSRTSAPTPEESAKKRITALRLSMTKLEELATESPLSFLAGLRQLIRDQLGELWNCPPEAITRNDIQRKLENRSPELLSIFNITEDAAYGGTLPDKATMGKYLQTVRNELEKLI